MPTRRRAGFPFPPGAGGGAPATVGNFNIGPDYGERPGNDGITNEMGVQMRLPAVALATADEIGVRLLSAASVALAVPSGLHLAGSALGAPFWQSVGTSTLPASTTTTDTTLTVTHPSGLAVGDLMLAFIGANGVAGAPSPITPAGWTALDLIPNAANLGGRAFRKVATAGDVAAGSTSWNLSAVGGVVTATGEIHRIIAFDTTTPVNAQAMSNWSAASGADPNVLEVTTTVINCLVFEWVLHDHLALSQTHGPPAGHAERTDFQCNLTATFLGSWSATRVFAAAGATGTALCNCTETVATVALMARVAIAPGLVVFAA